MFYTAADFLSTKDYLPGDNTQGHLERISRYQVNSPRVLPTKYASLEEQPTTLGRVRIKVHSPEAREQDAIISIDPCRKWKCHVVISSRQTQISEIVHPS